MRGGRDWSLDVMRGAAILSMVEIHMLIHVRPQDPVSYDVFRSLGTLAAPFFLICAGMGMGYLQSRYEGATGLLRWDLARRGLFLIGFATALGLYRLNLLAALDWDVFTVIGTMYVTSALVGGIRVRGALVGLGVVVFVNNFVPVETIPILRDPAFSFPIVPFAAYVLFGILLAGARNLLQKRAVATAAALLSSSVIAATLYLRGATVLQVERFDVFGNGGLLANSSLFLLGLLAIRALQGRSRFWAVGSELVRMGNVSFSLYYVQYGFLILIPAVLARVLGRPVLWLMPTPVWLAVLILFCALLYGLVRVWALFDFKFGLEWFISNFVSRRPRSWSKAASA